ncbi:MAG: ferredoxin family protein [Chloroflexi bacterium]|nr:ferredoxin family protein [Chloroflexota bacterium]
MPPRIDQEKCDGCGICIFQCGAWVFGFKPDRYKAYAKSPRDCVDCFICETKCPQGAISIKLRPRRRDDAQSG